MTYFILRRIFLRKHHEALKIAAQDGTFLLPLSINHAIYEPLAVSYKDRTLTTIRLTGPTVWKLLKLYLEHVKDAELRLRRKIEDRDDGGLEVAAAMVYVYCQEGGLLSKLMDHMKTPLSVDTVTRKTQGIARTPKPWSRWSVLEGIAYELMANLFCLSSMEISEIIYYVPTMRVDLHVYPSTEFRFGGKVYQTPSMTHRDVVARVRYYCLEDNNFGLEEAFYRDIDHGEYFTSACMVYTGKAWPPRSSDALDRPDLDRALVPKSRNKSRSPCASNPIGISLNTINRECRSSTGERIPNLSTPTAQNNGSSPDLNMGLVQGEESCQTDARQNFNLEHSQPCSVGKPSKLLSGRLSCEDRSSKLPNDSCDPLVISASSLATTNLQHTITATSTAPAFSASKNVANSLQSIRGPTGPSSSRLHRIYETWNVLDMINLVMFHRLQYSIETIALLLRTRLSDVRMANKAFLARLGSTYWPPRTITYQGRSSTTGPVTIKDIVYMTQYMSTSEHLSAIEQLYAVFKVEEAATMIYCQSSDKIPWLVQQSRPESNAVHTEMPKIQLHNRELPKPQTTEDIPRTQTRPSRDIQQEGPITRSDTIRSLVNDTHNRQSPRSRRTEVIPRAQSRPSGQLQQEGAIAQLDTLHSDVEETTALKLRGPRTSTPMGKDKDKEDSAGQGELSLRQELDRRVENTERTSEAQQQPTPTPAPDVQDSQDRVRPDRSAEQEPKSITPKKRRIDEYHAVSPAPAQKTSVRAQWQEALNKSHAISRLFMPSSSPESKSDSKSDSEMALPAATATDQSQFHAISATTPIADASVIAAETDPSAVDACVESEDDKEGRTAVRMWNDAEDESFTDSDNESDNVPMMHKSKENTH